MTIELDDDMARYRQTETGHWVTTLHPYDLTNYHWAFSEDGECWLICRDFGGGDRRVVTKAWCDAAGALRVLRHYDRDLKPCIDRS